VFHHPGTPGRDRQVPQPVTMMADNSAPLVLREDKGAIALLLLNRPAQRNALLYESWTELSRQLTDTACDGRIRGIVIAGTGGFFSAGGDLKTGPAHGVGPLGPAGRVEHAQRVLEQEGYTVLVAEDGYDALAVATAFSGRIDILVTDMVLPGLRGREVAARLLSTRPEMRTLYITGYTDDDFFAPGPHGEHACVLQKPFNLGQLADAVLLALLREDSESGRSAGS